MFKYIVIVLFILYTYIYTLYMHLVKVFVVCMLYICYPLTQHLSTSTQTGLTVPCFLFSISLTDLVYLPTQTLALFSRRNGTSAEVCITFTFGQFCHVTWFSTICINYICWFSTACVIYPAADSLFGTSLLQHRAEKRHPGLFRRHAPFYHWSYV